MNGYNPSTGHTHQAIGYVVGCEACNMDLHRRQTDEMRKATAIKALGEGMIERGGFGPKAPLHWPFKGPDGLDLAKRDEILAAIAAERERIYLETYTVLACARFVILCQRDGLSVAPDKVQDAVERIDVLIRNQAKD